MPIDKILIANRGEIACRVIRTARRLGIATVAVYSDADARALHVELADEAVHVGGAASADSYLRIDRIVAAAVDTGCDAVHPGFGFLSENPAFPAALEAVGVTFIGPGPDAMRAMGDKIESKRLAAEAGVSTVPGSAEALGDADEAVRVAEEIGCPVMLKASAGGGGKGMRVAHDLDEVRAGFEAARNEARSSFGDDRVFVEKFVVRPRHIEIQVMADAHGSAVYLGERECSIQRRHQKVIEEAPSPFIDPATRRAMGEQAVALARAVDYRSAGTVEFIVDGDRNFYFLEMNTRLQVEHPVTECVTGLDLVELMIRVAEGERLPISQDEVHLVGHALEARVYAEDADRGFLPSTGRVSHLEPPVSPVAELLPGGRDSASARADPEAAGAFVRVDSGIAAGDEISVHYDPMIAKLVTWAPTREGATEAMLEALAAYRIEGVRHNIPFLSAAFDHAAFRAGNLTTGFIDEHFPDGYDRTRHTHGDVALFAPVAAFCERARRARDRVDADGPIPAVADPFAPPAPSVESGASGSASGADDAPIEAVVLDGRETVAELTAADLGVIDCDWRPGARHVRANVGGRTLRCTVDHLAEGGGTWRIASRGATREYRVLAPRTAALLRHIPEKVGQDLSKLLVSPMPGLLTKVLVAEGDVVTVGQPLAVIEAMKMENTLASEVAGTVSTIVASEGASLAVDETILEFEG